MCFVRVFLVFLLMSIDILCIPVLYSFSVFYFSTFSSHSFSENFDKLSSKTKALLIIIIIIILIQKLKLKWLFKLLDLN